MSSDSDNAQSKLDLNKLMRKRSAVKGRLTKLKDHIEAIRSLDPVEIKNTKLNELLLRLKKCQELSSSFDEVQSYIEDVCDNLDEQLIIRDAIESQLISLLSTIQVLVESAKPDRDACSEVRSSNSNVNEHNIKLPTIKLPLFDGDHLKWLEFRDMFDSLIHSNDSIPQISKFHYLRSALEGGALVVIKSIEFTSQNYSIAWELLCERYNDKNILINNHLKALFSLESIHKASHKALRFIIDVVSKNLRSLNSLGLPTEGWDTMVIFLVCSKLDATTNCKWEEYKVNITSLPTLIEFFQFLRNRAAILETTQASHNEKVTHPQRGTFVRANPTKSYAVSIDETSNAITTCSNNNYPCCVICSQTHFIHECPKFKNMSIESRKNEVLRLKLCSNCLRKGHRYLQCRLKGSCRLCKSKHNTLLHLNKPKPIINSTEVVENLNVPTLPISLSAVSVGQVLLCTAVVEAINEHNNVFHQFRALLDTGSQSSFVTEHLLRKLNLPTEQINMINVSGINNASFNINECCYLSIKSCTSTFNIKVKCLVVPNITGILPSINVDINNLNLPTNIELADPQFHHPSNIDILLGADVFWDIVGSHRIKLGIHKPVLQSSQFGWLISGPIGHVQQDQVRCNFSREVHDTLKLFWEIDELHPKVGAPTIEQNLCEIHFVENTTRLPSGRFSVKIPFKEEPERALGDSFSQAKIRFFNLERRLSKLPLVKQQYKDFIKEYSKLNHLCEVNKPDFGYYLPHHAVIRDKSETTKLRVVFDGSAKTTSGKSINDIQLIGPVVQDDLLSILIRFRCHKYVLTADIQKHYRQIEINPSQRHLQLIIWRDNESQPIKVLQLNTVTYGTASAPFLSTRCLLQLSRECSDPIIASTIEHDIYVDNLATGSSSEEGIKFIHDNVTQVLNSACFPLHKIMSNAPNLNQNHSCETPLLNKESSVLGLQWSPKSDNLNFAINITCDLPITKRSILRSTCTIFDPLGLVCACVIKAKIILQKLWSSKLSWDDSVPKDLSKQWSNLACNLNQLSYLHISRNVVCDLPMFIELHCFVDASQDAYGTCVYVRSVNSNKQISVKLLCAKARVAPIKSLTIPRLELCGALLGARLCSKIIKVINLNINRIIFWTDSSIVLCWIRTPQKLLKTFVSNRIQEISELTTGHTWRHVPTDLNPADLASRGVEPQDLLKGTSLWWEGPPFLKEDSLEWPQAENLRVELPELKVHVMTQTSNIIEFTKYSNFLRLKRSFAYILRFINNINKMKPKRSGPVQVNELDEAQIKLIKLCQLESFNIEIKTIYHGDKLHHKSKLLPLNPFIDADGILRVGGRLKFSNYDFNKKHPIILNSQHNFTKLLMKYEHQRLFHAGPQLLLASIRERFWPLGGRALARSVSKACIICSRFRGKTLQPLMGHLPAERTSINFPFYTCGTDFGGPFMISSKRGRGNRITKCYLCIFVCLVTKAVHLELVSDLSTEAFILCLRRFVSRRGKPRVIHCDNGTNFVGANNELSRILRSSRQLVCDFASTEGINIKFIPAYSPHFGGIWEAGIKSSKFHIKRVAGNASLTFEELTTLFVQIEAILNSRPLSPLSSDPSDINPLTPGHFLIGRPLMAVPSESIETKHPNRYQLIEKIRQAFWTRWTKEYLNELQTRQKWRSNSHAVRVGDLMLIKEENLPPLRWKLGRIAKLYPGPDKVVRVVDLLTNRGPTRLEKRAVNRLVPLPVSTSNEQSSTAST